MARHLSYWNATAPAAAFPALAGDIEADVAIDRRRHRRRDHGAHAQGSRPQGRPGRGARDRRGGDRQVDRQDHLAAQYRPDTIIESKFGEDGARLYAEANEAGLARDPSSWPREHGIACNLERKPAFTYTQRRSRGRPDRGGGRGGAALRPAGLADPRHRPAVRGARRDALGRSGPIPPGQICEGARRDPAGRRLPRLRTVAGDRLGSAPDRDRRRAACGRATS